MTSTPRRRHSNHAKVPASAAWRWLLALLLLVMLDEVAVAAPSSQADVGETIFLRGILPDGTAVQGRRTDGTVVSGGAAACATCHRRSGLGAVEGTVWVPPITGPALFGTPGQPVVVRLDRRFNTAVSTPHRAYSREEFRNILGNGSRPDGSPLHSLMPRYEFDATAIAGLAAYLERLGHIDVPGVREGSLHLATVITPDLSPARRAALKATLATFVAQRNVSQEAGLRKKIPAAERRLRTRRPWVLDFWELTGTPAEWPAQLSARQATQPVFALLSGTTSLDWQPIADFCSSNAVACWFPTLDKVPVATAADRFNLYFSQGAALDAGVILKDIEARKGRNLVVVHDGSTFAETVASALRTAMGSQAARGQITEIAAADIGAVRSSLAHLGARDSVVLAGGPDLAQTLTATSPPRARLYLAYGDNPAVADLLPTAWRKQAFAVDRFEQGKLRDAGLKRFREWANSRGIAIADERLQAEAFFAASFLAMTVTDLLNNLQPDYLIERAQDTLSMREAERLQMEVQSLMSGGGGRRPVTSPGTASPAALDLATQQARTGTSLYPRLSLGPGQHYAAQGAFLRELDTGKTVWLVP